MSAGFVPFRQQAAQTQRDLLQSGRHGGSGSAGERSQSISADHTETETKRARVLARHLEDFRIAPPKAAPVAEVPEVVQDEPTTADVAPLLSLTQGDLDALCRTAFEGGREEGRASATKTLESEFATLISKISDAFDAESARRMEAAQGAGETMVQTVLDLIVALTRLPGETLQGLKRDLLQDAADLVAACEGDVSIKTSPENTERLQAILGERTNIRFDACAEGDASTIRIESGARTILIDPNEWRQNAINRIITSVSASTDRDIDTSRTTDRH